MKICFVDMDGVLCDFVGSACKLFGQPELADNWPLGQYDMGTALGCSTTDFWNRIKDNPDFWAEMTPYPWYQELLDMIRASGFEVFISTSPSFDPNSAKGKVAWLQKHYGKRFRNYFIGSEKFVLAGPGRILIDDSGLQVDSFQAAGGRGCLFPRPWNSNHGLSDMPLKYCGGYLEVS